MMLFISPHNDDEVLFGAYTLMRDNPLVFVATLSKRQGSNALERLLESKKACEYLGCSMISSGIYDEDLTEENLTEVLKHFAGMPNLIVFAPSYYENGHRDHNICNQVASKLFENVVYYNSYTLVDGRAFIDLTGVDSRVRMGDDKESMERKAKALSFYKTQIERPSTAEFFNRVNKEYYAE